jgi:predicted ATPase/DNA-binding CsgD family transcriptional regulator
MRHSDPPAGLPPGGDGFVGRERELDRIGVLLMGPARLVTLIGSGGIGKTRLAEEAARRLNRARRTPVWCVRLAGLPKGADAAAVKDAVTGPVLVNGFHGASAWDGVIRTLSQADAAGRVVHTMLLLDNCEHVLAGAGAVITDLLDAVPGLTVLATSREPVGWIDEQLEAVPPLSATQSLELFRQRAELAEHAITKPGQLKLAKQVCGHMHGNPLYIRLAAARMFYEPLPMILEQLSGESNDARMQWRHGPRAGSEGRHHTITDVIGWSYQLCGDKQRLLFDRLSVFAPGYETHPEDAGTSVVDSGAELEAIEVVCADDVPIRGDDGGLSAAGADQGAVRLARTEIRELLDQLVEQSLVSAHITADTVRYFLLESLRLFAQERLAERSTEQSDESARLARRHCYYYRNKVLQPPAGWFGAAEEGLLTWARGAWSNIRRAIDFSLEAAGKAGVGLQICVGLLSLSAPFYLGSLPEIRSRVEQTLAATQASEPRLAGLQFAALAQTACLAVVQGRPQDAAEILELCAAACDADAADQGHWRDRPDTDIGLPAAVEAAWGVELMLAHRDPSAIEVFARAREKFRSIAFRDGEALSGMFEALAAGLLGSAEQAMSICQRHLEQTTAAGAEWARSWAQLTSAIALTKHGDPEKALELGRAALAYQLSMGDNWGTVFGVEIRVWSLARLLTDQVAAGNTRRSVLVKLATEIACLIGGVTRQLAGLGVIENPFTVETSAATKVARDVLGQEAYIDAEKRGSQLASEHFELQRFALGQLRISTSPDDDRASAGAASSWQTLSEAEQEVAILAAAGWPNSAIGVRRGTSTRTTDAQISSVFQKLMISSREDIVRFVPKDDFNRVSAERSHLPRQSRDKPRSIHPRPQG